MSIAQSMLPEFDQETANTRKVLERLPEDKFEYKPHEKSGTLVWLAAHVAHLPGWTKETFTLTELDLSPDGKPFVPPPPPKTSKELLANFDNFVTAGRAALAAASDADMMVPWSLKMNGTVIFQMPRIATYRGMVMNHMIHHRAQLTVYMRLLDIPVPGLYGPSADEKTF
jgi:uncharacterized damage-inducible protein DinB